MADTTSSTRKSSDDQEENVDDTIPLTCLSSEDHEDNIKDHLIHFLGCIEISQRGNFLNDDGYPLWANEREHQLKKYKGKATVKEVEEETRRTRRKRERWKSDCQSELRRIAYLRKKLKEDEKGASHLVTLLEDSSKQWRESETFQNNIEEVKKWRKGPDGSDDSDDSPGQLYKPIEDIENTKYESEKDINVPFMYFMPPSHTDHGSIEGAGPFLSMTHAVEPLEPGVPVWGQFPDQKTTVKHLLDNTLRERNLLFKNRSPHGIKYFHLPSNNMKVRASCISTSL